MAPWVRHCPNPVAQAESPQAPRMKQQLRQIYDDLYRGHISQRQALERIKAVKLDGQMKRIGALLATPVWQPCSGASATGGTTAFAEQHVILCEMPETCAENLAILLPGCNCLVLRSPEGKNIAERYSEYAVACFKRIQKSLSGKPVGKVLVQVVVTDGPEHVLLRGLVGLLKTAALENPQLTGQLILVPTGIKDKELVQRLHEERALTRDTLVRYEQGVRQVFGWQGISANLQASPAVFNDHGVYLITGGLGGMGLLFAKEIIAQAHEAKIVLTGRSALPSEKQSMLNGLPASAGQVTYRQLDLGNLEHVRSLIAAIQDEHGQLNGILHSAGMIADNFILKKTDTEFNEVLRPKVIGTYNLDQA